MQDKRNEIVKYQGGLRAIPDYHPLVQSRRRFVWLIVVLMVLVLALGFWLMPNNGLPIANHSAIANYAEIEMNPALSAEVNALKGQVIGLVSGSIESKLRALEESVKLGATENTLGTIEDLKSDIKVLRAYSELPKKQDVSVSNERLVQEVTHLKHLIYIILASCGLMFVAAAGIWIKSRRLPHRESSSYLGRR